MTAPPDIARPLLAWYDRHARALPWRVGPAERRAGIRPDPYHVWLSEVMLQQTTVTAVKPYFETFLARWPDIAALAQADPDAVMAAWAGLGYYSRARNLIACARIVAARGGRFPDTEAELRALPGIGAYTAAAIAAIAFDRRAAVVDGNVERVVARLMALETPVRAAKPAIRDHVGAMTPDDRPGDFAQAMMDLGATICTPRKPACVLCPVTRDCAAARRGAPEAFPVRIAKPARPLRAGAAYVARNGEGAILLGRRPPRGLLGGMAGPPTSAWTAAADGGTGPEHAPFAADWRAAGEVRHVFTHFELRLAIFRASVEAVDAPEGHWWSPATSLAGEALPSLMRKAVEAAWPGSTYDKKGNLK